jgi:epoxyqueuosine reductase
MTTEARRELTRELERRARAEGFEAFGVADATRLDRDAKALEAWLAGRMHAAMAWLARDPQRRSDPRLLLEGCRSVVVLAMNYYPGDDAVRVRPDRARVALYARGRDYHRVVGRALKRLVAWLVEASGAAARGFVDTGPVLERGWAERAGIGWIGKNSCLLTRDRGSWLLLAEILTAASLEPSAGPHADHCGTCTACIDACPTAAIVGPGVVDSNRCIAYWTIEHRGAIPEPRREGIGDWIFGCDICQEVCPWNHKSARPPEADRLEWREDLRGLDPYEMARIDEESFRRRYSGTSLMRAKWQGIRRNACVVLGNSGDEAAIPTLERASRDDDPVVRSHARWALGRLESE